MALNVNAALMQLDPLKPLGPRPDKKAESMELERLQLMREQFEETKRQNAQDAEWRKIAEAGAMTREQMASDRQAEHDRQAAVAENMKLRQEAIDSMSKRGADVEGMHLDANRLNELGGLAEFQGEDENGFPSFRVEIDAEAARQRDAEQEEQAAPFFSGEEETPAGAYGSMEEGMAAPPRLPSESTAQSLDRMNALGYDTLGLRGNMAGTGVGEGQELSTEEAFRSAQRAARGPDEPKPAAATPATPAPWQPGNLDRDEPEPVSADPGGAPYDLAGEADAAQDFAVPGRSTPMATPPPQLEPSIFQATGRPARGPDQRDIMGSVPKNVIDMGSMQDQRKQRLGPVMDNMVKSMPQAYQANTRASADAALGLGLPADQVAKQALEFNAPANAAQASELAAQRKKDEDQEKAAADAAPKALTRVQIQRLAEGGEKSADKVYSNLGLDEVPKRAAAAQTMLTILEDEDPNNDQAIAFELPNMLGSKGPQSNKDLSVALGIDAMSTTDQIKERVHNIIAGGYTEMRKETLIEIIRNKMDADEGLIYQFLDGIDEGASRAVDEDVRRGLLDYAAKNIPEMYRKAHATEKASRGGGPAPAASTTPSATPDSATPTSPDANGVPPADYGDIHIPEGTIAFRHNNPGNLIFAGQPGAEPGEDKKDKDGNVVAKWARFANPSAGLEALRLLIDANQEKTIRQFLSRYAPANDNNDTEKYISDAVRELKADSDEDPIYAMDTYDLMRFITKRESGLDMPYQYGELDKKNQKLQNKLQGATLGTYAREDAKKPTPPKADADDPFEGVD